MFTNFGGFSQNSVDHQTILISRNMLMFYIQMDILQMFDVHIDYLFYEKLVG